MKVLLDTQCWLWMNASPERFRPEAFALIKDGENDLLFSAASSWEIAAKYALGKLPLPEPPGEYVPPRIAANGVVPLPISHTHALEVAALPAHHRDPFDRLLIAQARIEGIPILTADKQFVAYGVTVLEA